MKLPIVVISYGAFGADQKKLLCYEIDGVPVFPIFHNPVIASQFAHGMQEIIEEAGDKRLLSTQICQKAEHARDMLMVIMSVVPDLVTVIFDPTPPQGMHENITKVGMQAKDEMCPMMDVIQELEDSLSST